LIEPLLKPTSRAIWFYKTFCGFAGTIFAFFFIELFTKKLCAYKEH
jgi:hypothetical protein